MATYGKILLIAMPVFLLLVLFEKWYGWYKGNDTVRNMDMVSSLTSGITNVTKDVLGLSVVVYSYGWMVKHLAIVQVNSGWWMYVIAFLVLDFAGYWIHRLAHRVNIFWNNHIIHHSSEEYNLACALRQSIAVFFRIYAVLLLPAALLGVPEEVIAIVAPLHLFIQFWYHTQHIQKMGLLEKIIVTPSHHRVHHAINPEYIDKNFSEVFIIWDKLFGTFQPELPHVTPVYGVTLPVRTWNPVKINFKHLLLLIKDGWHTKSWKNKFMIWFKETGWRPEDVKEKYPLKKIDDVYHFGKYETPNPLGFNAWCWFQLTMLLLFISYLFGNVAAIGSPGIYLYGLFIFIYVYAMTSLMDGETTSVYWEMAKALMGVYFLFTQGNWFGCTWHPQIVNGMLFVYFILSVVVVFYYQKKMVLCKTTELQFEKL